MSNKRFFAYVDVFWVVASWHLDLNWMYSSRVIAYTLFEDILKRPTRDDHLLLPGEPRNEVQTRICLLWLRRFPILLVLLAQEYDVSWN